MIYIDFNEPGGPEVLFSSDGPAPSVAADEVLIKVSAAGVNGPDIMQRKGLYPPPPGASPVLGLEVAGEIIETGSKVTSWQSGDLVCALVPGGGYAELARTKAAHCLPVPNGLTLVEAASLPETFFTVWSNLFDRAHLKSGESLLVHGGSGGIGVTAIQVAKSQGVTVFATAGSKEKCRACLDLGADAAIQYREEDFVERVKELTQGKGVNVVLDIVGGDYINRNLKCLALEGRLVTIAFSAGHKADISIAPIMLKRLTWTGSTLRPQSDEAKASIAESLRKSIWPLIENGTIRPVVYKTYPMSEAEQAHRLMESSEHIGKILLTM